jgi:GT2 family glycosyltransferase
MVVFILLNWNQYKDTSETIDSIKRLSYSNYKIVVIDNGSKDGSDKKIKKKYKDLIFVKNQVNQGFARGNNIGIKKALGLKPDYIFILNNDVTLEKNLLNKMVHLMEKDLSIGICGPQIFYYNEPNKLWFFGANVTWPLAEINIWNFNKINPYPQKVVLKTDFICGAAMLCRTKILKEVGLFDENFFIYCEDVDLSYRCIKANWQLKVLSTARMWHKVSSSATAGKTSHYLMGRNRLYLIRKHVSLETFWSFVVPYSLLKQCISLVKIGVRGIEDQWLPTTKGMIDYFRGYKGNQGLKEV